ncbi:helix-turn-helix transcriptional regulator [Streptomyces racemochromogenes]|uniref:helix-turn-helix domain-containing protein n=1 Tax=Streptomyces racemochromogenes TaxID=67353 RepID=UPI0031E7B763
MPPERSPEWVLARRRQVGNTIRRARQDADVTQEELALRAGIDRQTLNRIEQGHASPRLDSLILIADALGVPLARLMRD